MWLIALCYGLSYGGERARKEKRCQLSSKKQRSLTRLQKWPRPISSWFLLDTQCPRSCSIQSCCVQGGRHNNYPDLAELPNSTQDTNAADARAPPRRARASCLVSRRRPSGRLIGWSRRPKSSSKAARHQRRVRCARGGPSAPLRRQRRVHVCAAMTAAAGGAATAALPTTLDTRTQPLPTNNNRCKEARGGRRGADGRRRARGAWAAAEAAARAVGRVAAGAAAARARCGRPRQRQRRPGAPSILPSLPSLPAHPRPRHTPR